MSQPRRRILRPPRPMLKTGLDTQHCWLAAPDSKPSSRSLGSLDEPAQTGFPRRREKPGDECAVWNAKSPALNRAERFLLTWPARCRRAAPIPETTCH